VDDGVGFGVASTPARGSGMGLKNARLHLAHLYGNRAGVHVGTATGGAGVAVEVTLPLRRVPAPLDAGELVYR
jgi:signal transduction histidine kinase